MKWENVVLELERERSHRLYCLHGKNSPDSADLRGLFMALKKSRLTLGYPGSLDIVLLTSRAQYINRHKYEGLFYQQRYQASYNDRGETVQQRLEKAHKVVGSMDLEGWIEEFEMEELFDKPLLQLSSGEWQRFSVCEALLTNPGMLIIPDLLKGLDHRWQQKILTVLSEKLEKNGIALFTSDVPIIHPSVRNIIMTSPTPEPESSSIRSMNENLASRFHHYQSTFLPKSSTDVLLNMTGVNIKYGDKSILRDIHWRVHAGDKWNIQGPNGAGKSTLISLVNSDNPQGYSQDIELFGSHYSQRSIWERKARIAFFGSDFFQYFRSSKSVEQTLHHQLKTPYMETIQPPASLVNDLLIHFGLYQHRTRPYSRLHPELRRQLLLLTTYLKSSDILVLDEPYQDFSLERIRLNNHFLESIHSHSLQTVLFVTHREDHKPKFLDQILKLNQGNLSGE